MTNHFIESYFTMYHSASFSSQASLTMLKNKLFKLENNVQNWHQLYTMKKNKLFIQEVNQNTKQVSTTLKKNKFLKQENKVQNS